MRARRGANAVEFALCLPIFVMTTFGMMDFCWVAWQWTTLHNASITACRYGSVRDPGKGDTNLSNIVALTKARMVDDARAGGVPCGSCTPDAYATGLNPERALVCNLSLDVPSLTGLVLPTIRVRGGSVTRFEYQR